jgi:hypothetical protein
MPVFTLLASCGAPPPTFPDRPCYDTFMSMELYVVFWTIFGIAIASAVLAATRAIQEPPRRRLRPSEAALSIAIVAGVVASISTGLHRYAVVPSYQEGAFCTPAGVIAQSVGRRGSELASQCLFAARGRFGASIAATALAIGLEFALAKRRARRSCSGERRASRRAGPCRP